MTVGNDKTMINRQYIARKIRSYGKEKTITTVEVIHPLLIRAKISTARFDFNNHELTSTIKRYNVSTSFGAERKLLNGIAKLSE